MKGIRRKNSSYGGGYELPITEEMRNYSEQRYIKKLERRREKIDNFVGVLKFVFFTPLIKICEILTAVMKMIAGISVFGFFYGVYKFYVYFSGGINEDLFKAVVFCVFPFIAYFLVWGFNKLSDVMSFSLRYHGVF